MLASRSFNSFIVCLLALGTTLSCQGELGTVTAEAGLMLLPDAALSISGVARDAGGIPPQDAESPHPSTSSAPPGTTATSASTTSHSALDGSAPTSTLPVSSGSSESADAGPPPGSCAPVRSHKDLPMRTLVSDPRQHAEQRVLLTADLYTKFYALCGGCHVDQAMGGWQVTRATFSEFDQAALDRVTSDVLGEGGVMPPGIPYSSQPAGSLVRDLVASTQKWLEEGSPNDFVISTIQEPTDEELASGYLLTAEQAAAATDLGTCIPSSDMVGTETARMDELDEKFAKFTSFASLPKKLSETDLFTLDSATLARHGVISYAPTYALFSDDAGKMRYVRVPRGESVHFDASRQEFEIPPNTRIYKTFLKEVIDAAGARTWRKLETRLIVVRPDEVLEKGAFRTTALFATYAWNEAETEAYLLTDPKRDSTPFADRMVSYFQNEPATDDYFAALDPELPSAVVLDQLQEQDFLRHWAIPSGDRCVECHRGSPNHSFLLGFSPIQLRRVPTGEQGEYNTEAGQKVEEDELSQLARLIDYGIVTGLDSEDEVEPLDRTQSAPPRNEQELRAQAYMVGNCGFCHNPHGLPSVQNPELTDLLNFWPNRHLWPEREVDGEGNPIKTIGVFQFPLERKSPRIKRGPNQDIAIPYITSSLFDFPIGFNELGPDSPTDPTPFESSNKSSYPKFQLKESSRDYQPLPAPWRSLIYRNVDTPFTYADHYAVYPHMPMNVGGYDCKARHIMAEWMLSIPTKHVQAPPEQNPAYFFYCDNEYDSSVCQESWSGSVPTYVKLNDYEMGPGAVFKPEQLDRNEQPVYEIKPGEDGYAGAAYDGRARIEAYYAGMRGQCTPPADMLDPKVLDLSGTVVSQEGRSFETPPSFVESLQMPAPGATVVTPDSPRWTSIDGIPDHPHWVNTDLTEPATSEWQPKNLSWAQEFADPSSVADPTRRHTLELLNTLRVTRELRDLALGERAMGFWQPPGECDLSTEWTANKLQAAGRTLPDWLTRTQHDPDAALYMQSPGEAVFTAICQNCHGPNADSKGRQASLVSTLTGGNTRVANFKDGLFGPIDAPGAHLTSVFAPEASGGETADDVAARYMAFMALGGTQRTIPRAVLSIVRNTSVVGVFRRNSPAVASANMLETAVGLCTALLGANREARFGSGRVVHDGKDGLILENGDFELWEALCNFNNPRPLTVIKAAGDLNAAEGFYSYHDSTGRVIYPQNAPVLDHSGQTVTGLRVDNLFPMCAHPNPEGGTRANGPVCPPEIVGEDGRLTLFKWDANAIRAWAVRGAANAGFSVYLYLDAVLRRGYVPKRPFNECPN